MIRKTLDALYFVCRKAFKDNYDRLKKADDPKSAFIDALYCEICANTISLCIELSCGLTNSPAMETSCRSILEAMALREMVIRGDLDDEHIANFEKQSALLFYGNIFDTAKEEKDEFFSASETDDMKKKIDWIVADYKRALESYRKTYGENFDERASRDAIREGLFFTYNKPSDKKKNTFSKLFNKYLGDGDKSHSMYDRISFFAHPWYLDNLEDLNVVRQERFKDVGRCLEKVRKLFSNELETASQTEGAIVSDLDALGVHLHRIQSVESICSNLYQNASRAGSPISYSSLCFAFLQDILTEMNIMNGLGYPEMALSKFQSAAEFWAMNAILNNASDPVEFTALHQAFDYSTRVHIRKLGGYERVSLKDDQVLKKAFESAFQNPSISFDEYKKSVVENSLFFLNADTVKRASSWFNVLRLGTDIAFPPQHLDRRKSFVLVYLFSIDVHHATGFCYMENRDCWLLLSHVGLRSVYECIWYFAMLMSIPPNETPAASLACKELIDLIDAETQEISSLNLQYPE